MINNTLSVVTIIDELTDITPIVETLKTTFDKNAYIELIFIATGDASVTITPGEKITNDFMEIKFVRVNKLTKHENLRNIAWQVALGDTLVFAENVDVLMSMIYQAANNPQCFSEDTVFKMAVCESDPWLDSLNEAYAGKLSYNLDLGLMGYAISRSKINESFYESDNVIDSYFELATHGRMHIQYISSRRAKTKYSCTKDLLLNYASPKHVLMSNLVFAGLHSILISAVLLFALVMTSDFTHLTFIPQLFVTLLFCVVLTFVILLQTTLMDNATLTKYAIGAASDKKVAGNYTITDIH